MTRDRERTSWRTSDRSGDCRWQDLLPIQPPTGSRGCCAQERSASRLGKELRVTTLSGLPMADLAPASFLSNGLGPTGSPVSRSSRSISPHLHRDMSAPTSPSTKALDKVGAEGGCKERACTRFRTVSLHSSPLWNNRSSSGSGAEASPTGASPTSFAGTGSGPSRSNAQRIPNTTDSTSRDANNDQVCTRLDRVLDCSYARTLEHTWEM